MRRAGEAMRLDRKLCSARKQMGHVERQIYDPVLDHDVFLVQHERSVKERRIFTSGKFFGYIALAYAPCTIQHHGRPAVTCLLPFEQSVAYLALHLNSFVKRRILDHTCHVLRKCMMAEIKGFGYAKITRFQRIRKVKSYTFSGNLLLAA